MEIGLHSGEGGRFIFGRTPVDVIWSSLTSQCHRGSVTHPGVGSHLYKIQLKSCKMAPMAGWRIKLPPARFVSGAERVKRGDREGKKETMWRWIFYRLVTADEDALLINLLLKEKRATRLQGRVKKTL